MNIYHYHPLTGECLGQSEADKSPLEPDVYLVPAHATNVAPPQALAGEIAVFSPNGWSLMEDHRGETYWLSDGTEMKVGALGRLPDDALLAPPPPTLEKAREGKLAELGRACKADIYAGFVSGALGASHKYPAKDTDQQNLSASVLASLLPNLPSDWTTDFWCADRDDVWALRPHTAAQIQQVGIEGKEAVSRAIAKKARLEQRVLDAATLDAVQAIVWS